MVVSLEFGIDSSPRAATLGRLLTFERDIFAILDFLTFIVLYNNLIPISLIVTMEVVRYIQAQLINSDLDMYSESQDTPALCRTSSLVEELGSVDFVLSDKTGTLTQNIMVFQECSIAGTMYSETVDENKREQGQQTFRELLDKCQADTEEGEIIREYLAVLSVAHTVIPTTDASGTTIYQASSPDEAALVAGGERLGYKFTVSLPFALY